MNDRLYIFKYVYANCRAIGRNGNDAHLIPILSNVLIRTNIVTLNRAFQILLSTFQTITNKNQIEYNNVLGKVFKLPGRSRK